MAAQAQWGYCSHNGPATWPNNIPAAGGKRQSPIDIKPEEAQYDEKLAGSPLRMSHSPASAKDLINNGRSVQVTYDIAGSSLEGGPLNSNYQLAQFHFHWGKTSDRGSEHTINGKMTAAEVHLVHWNTGKYSKIEEALEQPDGLCVLGALFTPGKEHAGLKQLTDKFSQIKHKDQKIQLGAFDPESLLPENKKDYWTYPGSLTTPPCKECITWVVFKDLVEVSEEQLEAFRALYSTAEGESAPANDELKGHIVENYRPPCNLNDRVLRASFKA